MQEDTIPGQPALASVSPLSTDLGKEFAPLSPEYTADPYPFYARARKEEPVFFSQSFNLWVISRYEEVTAVLKDHQRFAVAVDNPRAARYTPEVLALLSTNPLADAPTLLAVDLPEHMRLRSTLNKAFSAQRVAKLEPRIHHLANQLIDQFEHASQADFMAQFAHRYPIRVICNLLDVPEADMERIQGWSDDTMSLMFADLTAEGQLPCAQGYLALQHYVADLAEQRRVAPQDDLASDLRKEVEEGQAPLTTGEAAQILFLLLMGGFETTTRFLGNCLSYLLTERTSWQAIVDDPRLIPAVIEEGLRFASPAIGTFRKTTEMVELGGKSIPKGAMVQVLLASADHDEAIFRDAENFHLQREKLNRHVAFGYGIHHCVGAPLARLELRVALEQLSQRLPSLRLVPDQEPSYIPGLVTRGMKQLLVEWGPTQ